MDLVPAPAASVVPLRAMPIEVSVVPTVTVIESVAMLAAVLRRVDGVVPVVLDKIDRSAASIVACTVSAPVPGLTRRHMEVDRFGYYAHRRWLDYDRPRIYQDRPRSVPYLNLAVETAFAYIDRHADVGGERRRGGCDRGKRCEKKACFHD